MPRRHHPGDTVRSRGEIKRGLLDDRGFADVPDGAEGRIVEEHQRLDGSWEYDVLFDRFGGPEVVHRVRHAELKPALFAAYAPKLHGGHNAARRSTSDGGGPEDSLYLLVLLLVGAGFGAWIFGAVIWYPGKQFAYPKGAYGPLALPTWLGGFSALAGFSLLCITLSRLNELAFARALLPAAATGFAAAGFWLIAPAIAHHNLSRPYATRALAEKSAVEVLEQRLDYRRPDWREPRFLATAAYEIATRCRPVPSIRAPHNTAAFHMWSCITMAGFHHHTLCRLPVRVTGYEVYRSQTVMGPPSKSCHHPGVTFIPASLAEEWAQTSRPTADGWRCHSSDALPHDPMATGDECIAGRERLIISALSNDKWTWRGYQTPIRRH